MSSNNAALNDGLETGVLNRLGTFTLGAIEGGSYPNAERIFPYGHFAALVEAGHIFSSNASEMLIAVDALIATAGFPEFFGNTATELEKLRLMGSQYLAVCDHHRNKLCPGGFQNFFLLTKGDEVVASDLSNIVVAITTVYFDGTLKCDHHKFHNVPFYGNHGLLRVFSAQQ